MEILNIERVCVKWPCREERLLPCPGSSTASRAGCDLDSFPSKLNIVWEDKIRASPGLFLL